MEDDDSDAEMADYGTDFSDDVDPNFDAKARPQQDPLSKYAHADPLQAHRGRSRSSSLSDPE